MFYLSDRTLKSCCILKGILHRFFAPNPLKLKLFPTKKGLDLIKVLFDRYCTFKNRRMTYYSNPESLTFKLTVLMHQETFVTVGYIMATGDWRDEGYLGETCNRTLSHNAAQDVLSLFQSNLHPLIRGSFCCLCNICVFSYIVISLFHNG
jgi:hypothetical protein